MVKGIDIFQDYFREYTDQYVLIGGAACSLSFDEQDINFGRTTKDLDIVLIVEAQTKEFGERFWQFIKDGWYQNRAKSNGKPQFYRFDKPEDERFPKMIELFSRTDYVLKEENPRTKNEWRHYYGSIASTSVYAKQLPALCVLDPENSHQRFSAKNFRIRALLSSMQARHSCG